MHLRLLLFALLLLGQTGLQAITRHLVDMEENSRVRIIMEALYDQPAPGGFDPWRVTITNGSSSDDIWILESNSSISYRYGDDQSFVQALEVEAGETRTFEVCIPLPSHANDPYGSGINTNVSISGPDVLHAYFYRGGARHHGHLSTLHLGLSQSLYNDFGPLLESKYSGTHLTQIIPMSAQSGPSGSFLEDYRAYLGFNALVLTKQDWSRLDTAKQQAVLDAVSLGVELRILYQGEPPKIQNLASRADKDARFNQGGGFLGFGAVHFFEAESGKVQKALRQFHPNHNKHGGQLNCLKFEHSVQNELLSSESGPYQIEEGIEPLEMPKWLITISVLGFAAVVGPVNFLFFARGARRYRLLFTIPLISVASAFLLFLIILFSDGVGGQGKYVQLTYFLPESGKAAQVRWQLAQTSLLLDRGFEMDAGSFLLPITSSIKQSSRRNRDQGSSLNISENFYSGDWFRSRIIQAHRLATVKARRGWVRIDQKDGKLTAVSNLKVSLKELWYVDTKGNYWKGKPLEPGASCQLEAVGRIDRQSEMVDLINLLPDGPGPVSVTDLHNHVLAFADTTAETLETLDSIDWECQGHWMIGLPDNSQEQADE